MPVGCHRVRHKAGYRAIARVQIEAGPRTVQHGLRSRERTRCGRCGHKGVNFMWLEKSFSAFKGKAVTAEETDEICLSIIAKYPMRERQALLIEP